jgi:hypothetical protein
MHNLYWNELVLARSWLDALSEREGRGALELGVGRSAGPRAQATRCVTQQSVEARVVA